jgi:hypothetical protein
MSGLDCIYRHSCMTSHRDHAEGHSQDGELPGGPSGRPENTCELAPPASPESVSRALCLAAFRCVRRFMERDLD